MAYLTLKNINKIYPNGFHAVHDFNLEMEKGEFIVNEPPELDNSEIDAVEPTEEGFHYREISFEDFNKLRDAGFDVASNCRQSTNQPDIVILRYTEQQAAEINAVLQPVNAMKR